MMGTVVTDVVNSLREAKKIIADPHQWGKGRNVIHYRGGTQYCAMTALNKVTPRFDQPHLFKEGRRYLIDALPSGHTSAVTYNDLATTRHVDILYLYDRAITLAEEN